MQKYKALQWEGQIHKYVLGKSQLKHVRKSVYSLNSDVGWEPRSS